MRPIDADALTDRIMAAPKDQYQKDTWFTARDVVNLLNTAPRLNPPRDNASWTVACETPEAAKLRVKATWKRPAGSTPKSPRWRCGACDSIAYDVHDYTQIEYCTLKFCPHCGCPMYC